ncbi:MAG: hypothetical protein R3F61_21025 [Myxococcota bacterium]
MRRGLIVLGGVLGALLVGGGTALAVLGVPLVDIRPDEVRLGDDPVAEARGRELLAEMLEAHGGADALLRHRTASFDFEDTWVGLGTLFNPWPDAAQRAHVTLDVHSFDSEVLLENGPQAGVTWGITDFATWRRSDGATETVHDADMRFMLPTVHYFFEMPQRLTEAAIVRYVGPREVRGERYEVVYATWGEPGANPDFDQYLIYLDPDSHRLAKVHYTVREIAPFVSGIAHLLDQREVDGFWVAHDIPVTTEVDGDPDANLHRMVFSNVAFD